MSKLELYVVNCLQNLLSLRSETTSIQRRANVAKLWIAYKIYYLCDRKQHISLAVAKAMCCELLTKFIIFAIGNNMKSSTDIVPIVVNCLQNLLSLRSETTPAFAEKFHCKLWIAYKIYYLCDRKQPYSFWVQMPIRCELLTKFIIFAIGNNKYRVVSNYMRLWIAYKIYYLCDRKQHDIINGGWHECCELLTKFIIFAIGNNKHRQSGHKQSVVNCLQNLLSLRSETTVSTRGGRLTLLWIAYKIYYLCDRKQLFRPIDALIQCCELLTKFIIFAIGNNSRIVRSNYIAVVNCLQNLLSLRSETTFMNGLWQVDMLWIAYKIYYLCDRKQQDNCETCWGTSCELLTKFIIFAIGNNSEVFCSLRLSVVNCLQNLLSLRSETTIIILSIISIMLWIAYKIYYLCDRKQPPPATPNSPPCCELLTKFIIFAIGNNQKECSPLRR